MDLTLLGALATGLATFSLLMAIFAPWLATPARDDAVRAAGLARERYVRLVSTERPAWESVLAPVSRVVAERVPALAERHTLERAVSEVADALHRASDGRNLLGEQVRSAVAAYGTGVDLYAALRDVAAAADLDELDELAGSLAQARHLGKGVGE